MRFDVSLSIGHNVHGVPTWELSDVVRVATKHGIAGATAYSVVGIWNGEVENTTVLEICDCPVYYAEHIRTVVVPAMCVELEQDCIMYKRVESRVEFITGKGE